MVLEEYNEQKTLDALAEDSKEEGRKEGKILAYLEMVKDGLLTLNEAATRLNITEEKLKKYF